VFVLATALAVAALAPAARGKETPSHAVNRLAEGTRAPEIDGVFDDPAWKGVTGIGPLTQVEPVAGAEPSERTEVLICYDADGVYLAIRCFDRDPSQIRATQMQRDADLGPDDRVEWVFDPFLDRRNGFWFQIGAGGSKGDALLTRNGSTFNKQWDGIWYGVSRVTDEGWQAEVAIPTKTLNFDPTGTAWGFNVRRHIRRRTEEVRWASPTPRLRFFAVANAGTLEGFSGLTQGIGLDLVPFAVANYDRDRTSHDDTTTGDVGLDAFWRLTPSMKLSASLNTDFAETEVDARRVNLTRFPLFFPEKRDFFLEDSGIFAFGTSAGRGGRSDVIPFFSRRIGIDGKGEEVPLLGAVKLTGQTDSYGFGLMDVQTDSTQTLDSENLFAGRFSKNVLDQSDVGVIWTHGNPESGPRSDTYGADFNFRTDEFLGDRNLRFTTWAVRSDNEGVGRDDLAYSMKLDYPNDEVDLSVVSTVIEKHFDPKLGFAPRTGIKKYDGRFSYRPRLNKAVRRLRFSVNPTVITDSGNETETVRVSVQPIAIDFESGDELNTFVVPTREVLKDPFDISTGVTIPMGGYDFVRYGVGFESSEKRPVSVDAEVTTGTFFDGDRTEVEAGVEWRASRHLQLEAEYEWNDVGLHREYDNLGQVQSGGDFTVNVARLRVTVLPNPNVSWSNFVQFDDDSEEMGLNSRLWWIFEPGNEAFLVLNQGWDTLDGMHGIQTSLAFKVGYTLRF
jgi:hypothetical protein